MSFEGQYETLCEKGHLQSQDAFMLPIDGFDDCFCGSKTIWWNLIDYTNGSFDDDGTRIDGWVELKVKEETKCSHCDTILEVTYKIPKNKGHKIEGDKK